MIERRPIDRRDWVVSQAKAIVARGPSASVCGVWPVGRSLLCYLETDLGAIAVDRGPVAPVPVGLPLLLACRWWRPAVGGGSLLLAACRWWRPAVVGGLPLVAAFWWLFCEKVCSGRF